MTAAILCWSVFQSQRVQWSRLCRGKFWEIAFVDLDFVCLLEIFSTDTRVPIYTMNVVCLFVNPEKR